MKKTKLIMPIIGISALGTSLVPLTTLTSCKNNTEYKVVLTKGTKTQDLYANTQKLNLFFKQNNTNNIAKTKVKMVNLKIDGAEASVVSGLTKIAVDSAGGIRVTLDIATMYSHYSDPTSIQFDLLFSNKANNQSYTVTDIILNVNQEEEVENPFAFEASAPTVITGFTEDLGNYAQADFARAYPDVFVEMTVSNIDVASIATSDDTPVEEDTTNLYYKMVIPKSFTAIADNAFFDDWNFESTLPSSIKLLDFAAGSKMTSIGEYAFSKAKLIYVTLPASIKTLGDYCFSATTNLMSMQFAPTSTNNLTLPVGFLWESAIPYIKLPNYITEIKSEEQGNEIVASIDSISPHVYVDLSDWTLEQVENLVQNQKIGTQAIKCSSGEVRLIASDISWVSHIYDGFNKFGITFKNATEEAIPYAYELAQGDQCCQLWLGGMTTQSTAMNAAIITILRTICEDSRAILSLPYPLFKYELPNWYFNPSDSKIYTVNQVASENPIVGSIGKITGEYVSSLVLPYKTATIVAKNFIGNKYLWQVQIPSTVKSILSAGFVDNVVLTNIVYDGTVDEWTTLRNNSASDWNGGCESPITVTCTDGTSLVKPIA